MHVNATNVLTVSASVTVSTDKDKTNLSTRLYEIITRNNANTTNKNFVINATTQGENKTSIFTCLTTILRVKKLSNYQMITTKT